MKIVQNNRDLAYFVNPEMNECIRATSCYFDEYEDINFDYLENMIKGITNTVYIVLEYKARTISERHFGISSLLKRYGIIGDIVYDSPEKQPQLVTRNAVIQISSDYCQPALKYLFQHFQKTILALPRINAMDSRFPILWKHIEDIFAGCIEQSICFLCSNCFCCITVVVGNDGTSCNFLSPNSMTL